MNNNNSNKNAQQHHYGIEFSLFVGDLPHDCSDEKLQRLFQSKYKSVKRVQIIRTDDGESRGFGFIRFEEKADFQQALSEGMKLDNTPLRLDTAHRSHKNNRTRYNSYNSSSSNNSNHYHNHHPFNNNNSNLHHQHHHDHQSHHHHYNQAPSHQQHGSQQHHPPNQQAHQSQHKGNQHHQGQDSKAPKQLGHRLGGDDDVATTQNKPQPSSQPARPAQHQPTLQASPISQSQMPQPNQSHIGVNISSANMAVTSTAVTSLPSSDISHLASALQSNQHSINAGQPLLGPDMRAYPQAPMMDNPHMMGGPDSSMMPPSSVYGHMYPYGPPPTFGYMPPPSQPNLVIPISAVPPAPPNQATSSGIGHSLPSAPGTNRYNNPHQQQQHSHQTQPTHAAVDANAMSAMTAAGVQAQTPFYYYYPSPLYFDQTGAAAPPNMYHPQSFHPQFFALPNPAYHIPNAPTYPTQHPAQTPLASQSDANAATLINQQRPPQQQQQPPPSLPSAQQQVNSRNRDIDAPLE